MCTLHSEKHQEGRKKKRMNKLLFQEFLFFTTFIPLLTQVKRQAACWHRNTIATSTVKEGEEERKAYQEREPWVRTTNERGERGETTQDTRRHQPPVSLLYTSLFSAHVPNGFICLFKPRKLLEALDKALQKLKKDWCRSVPPHPQYERYRAWRVGGGGASIMEKRQSPTSYTLQIRRQGVGGQATVTGTIRWQGHFHKNGTFSIPLRSNIREWQHKCKAKSLPSRGSILGQEIETFWSMDRLHFPEALVGVSWDQSQTPTSSTVTVDRPEGKCMGRKAHSAQRIWF